MPMVLPATAPWRCAFRHDGRRKHAICRVTVEARGRRNGVRDRFERYELDIYEAANGKYDRGDVAPDGGVVVASGDLAAVTEPTLTGC
jgi:hypothetical protein